MSPEDFVDSLLWAWISGPGREWAEARAPDAWEAATFEGASRAQVCRYLLASPKEQADIDQSLLESGEWLRSARRTG